MNEEQRQIAARRWFLGQCGLGLGSMALQSMTPPPGDDFRVPARVKNVIFLFMAGGPSQLELFDYKPKLQELSGKPVPESVLRGKRFAFMDSFFKGKLTLLGTNRRFARHGERGTWISELLPHTARIADKISIVRTFATDVPNHVPAKIMLNTGSPRFGRPSMGAWITYGIGSETRDLPGFVVLQSGPRGPRGGSLNWGSGFLPSRFQGVPFRASGDPILNLQSPRGVDPDQQRRAIDAINQLNAQQRARSGDPEIDARIAAYEMAFRMQAARAGSGTDIER